MEPSDSDIEVHNVESTDIEADNNLDAEMDQLAAAMAQLAQTQQQQALTQQRQADRLAGIMEQLAENQARGNRPCT